MSKRRFYRGASMRIDWDGDDLMERMYKLADEVTAKMAAVALNTAQSLVPVDEGTLRSQIDLKISMFEGGGAAIVAQGPDNYERFYATFTELGTHKTRNVPSQPFLRPAIKKVRRIFKKSIQAAIDAG